MTEENGDLYQPGEGGAATTAPDRPDKPGYVFLLAASIRMFDLHDAGRALGADHTQPPPEERSADNKGTYLSIAWDLLYYLQERELEGAFDYVDISSFAAETADAYNVTPADVYYVSNTLAQPTQLDFIDPRDRTTRRTTADTNLIRKKRRGQACMLAKAGREALAFASGYFKWVHAGAEAQKLVGDLQFGEYKSFFQIGTRLLNRIRQETHDIRLALEQPEVDDLRQSFLDNARRYTATIKELSSIVGQAQVQLTAPQTIESIDTWLTMVGEEEGYAFESFTGLTQTLLNAIANMQKLFSQFLETVQSREHALVGVVRFDAAAADFLRQDGAGTSSVDFLDTMFSGIGPLFPDIEDLHPLEHRGSIEVRVPRQRQPKTFRKATHSARDKDRIEKFIDANREEILRRLESGPLSLGEIAENGDTWLDCTELDGLAEMTSFFISPMILGLDDGAQIRLELGGHRVWMMSDGWEFSGPDVRMRLLRVGAPADQQEATP